MQWINEADPDLGDNYDPEDDTGTINWDNVVEIRYETPGSLFLGMRTLTAVVTTII